MEMLNELKLKVNELNELINNFEIENLKKNNNNVDFAHLTEEQLELIHANYDILDIYSEGELFGAAADNATSVNDIFDDITIADYAKDNFGLTDFFEEYDILDYVKTNFGIDELVDEYEMIDYVKYNYHFDDIFDDDELIEYLTSKYSLDDLADWRR